MRTSTKRISTSVAAAMAVAFLTSEAVSVPLVRAPGTLFVVPTPEAPRPDAASGHVDVPHVGDDRNAGEAEAGAGMRPDVPPSPEGDPGPDGGVAGTPAEAAPTEDAARDATAGAPPEATSEASSEPRPADQATVGVGEASPSPEPTTEERTPAGVTETSPPVATALPDGTASADEPPAPVADKDVADTGGGQAEPMTVTLAPEVRLRVGEPVDLAVPHVSNGSPPYAFRIGAGDLPRNLTLDRSTGRLVGEATEPGKWTIDLVVEDAAGGNASGEVAVVVAPREEPR